MPQLHIDGVHSINKILMLVWSRTVHIDMAFWCALNKHKCTREVTNSLKWRTTLGLLGVTCILFAMEMVLTQVVPLPTLLLLGSKYVVMGLLFPPHLVFSL